MAKLRVTLNHAAITQLLRGEGEFKGVRDDIDRRGEAVAAAAGEGFVYRGTVGANRYHGQVHADTFEAKLAEAHDRALTRAIDAGRA